MTTPPGLASAFWRTSIVRRRPHSAPRRRLPPRRSTQQGDTGQAGGHRGTYSDRAQRYRGGLTGCLWEAYPASDCRDGRTPPHTGALTVPPPAPKRDGETGAGLSKDGSGMSSQISNTCVFEFSDQNRTKNEREETNNFGSAPLGVVIDVFVCVFFVR